MSDIPHCQICILTGEFRLTVCPCKCHHGFVRYETKDNR